ncbi:MAG: isochorismatase family cysteine hydrolase [Ilumatobacteraceae bacterium]
MTARPAPFEFDPAATAVIVVDMQNDFASPLGMFDRIGVPLGIVRQVIEPTRKVLDAARHANVMIVYLAMQFDEQLSNMGTAQAPNRVRHLLAGVGQHVVAPDGTDGRFLISNTWNTRIIDELAPHDGELVIPKHRFSGFFETELDTVLKEGGIEWLVFTGCTTSVCVESTLRDAYFRDYRCLLLTDCCAEPIGGTEERTNHDATVTIVESMLGWTSTSDAFLSTLELSQTLRSD